MDLAERLTFVLNSRGWTARQWARIAGLSEENHVNLLIRRAKKGASVGVPTLQRLAEAANVSFDWLATGRGNPGQVSAEQLDGDDLYPSRQLAVAAARIWAFHPDAIKSVLQVNNLRADPGLQYWVARLQTAQEEALGANNNPERQRVAD